jgi:acyl-CoA thioester hydrolase
MTRTTLPPLEAFPHVRHITLLFGDVDPGWHVNNVAQSRFFEEARASMDRRAFAGIEDHEMRVVLSHVEIDYLREGKYPGEVSVGIGVERFGTSSWTMLAVLFQDGQPMASSRAVPVHIPKGRSAPLTPAMRSGLERFLLPEEYRTA